MGGGAIVDRHINWKSKRWFIPVQAMGNDVNTSMLSLGQGTPTLEPASGTLEDSVIPMTTADEVEFVRPIPWDLDRAGDVAARAADCVTRRVLDVSPSVVALTI